MKEYGAKIGIELALDPKTLAVRNSIYQKKTHAEMMLQSQSSGFPQHNYPMRQDNEYNLSIVDDPEMDRLYNEISVMTAYSDAWWAKLSEINLYDIDRVYYVTIPSGYEWAFWQPWVRRYYGESDVGPYKYNNQTLQHMWLDQELKTSLGY